MDDLEKFNETKLPEKGFYSHLNIEDITNSDYALVKEFVKILK